MRAILLGTSSSIPIPVPACDCAQCAEARREPALRRSRSGLFVEAGGETLLVDASADVLFQLEREGLSPGVGRLIVTHTHGDHILGLDDLVRVRDRDLPPLEVCAAPFHRLRIAAMFPGLVKEGAPRITFAPWRAGVRLEVGALSLEGFETGHRDAFPTTGVLFEGERDGRPFGIAYATDMGPLPEASLARLGGCDVLVADGTYPATEGHGHPGSAGVRAEADGAGVRRLVFTHVGHIGVEAAEIARRYGEGVGVARDGDDLFAFLPPA